MSAQLANSEAEIISAITGIPATIPPGRGDAEWTAAIKRALMGLGKKNGYNVCGFPPECENEWLYAQVRMKGIETPTLVWIDRKEYDKKWNAWSSNPSAMCEKVAVTNACKKACGISGLQSEYDFDIKGSVAIPIQDVKSETELEMNKKKIIEALATYEGEDKELEKPFHVFQNNLQFIKKPLIRKNRLIVNIMTNMV